MLLTYIPGTYSLPSNHPIQIRRVAESSGNAIEDPVCTCESKQRFLMAHSHAGDTLSDQIYAISSEYVSEVSVK